MAGVFEKVLIVGSMVGIGVSGLYVALKPDVGSQVTKNEVVEKRVELLQKPNVKMLYSTMSFFYLEGYDQNKPESFLTLYDILRISKPNMVALQISEKEYNEIYQPVVLHPKFEDAMRKVEYLTKLKNVEELKNMKELKFEHLSKIYPIYFCKKNSCTIICGDQHQENYEKLSEAKMKLAAIIDNSEVKDKDILSKDIKEDLSKKREEFYVDRIMEKMNPKFSVIPQSMYKTIVGVVDNENLNGVASVWKTKFKTVYNHEILEDQGEQNLKPIS